MKECTNDVCGMRRVGEQRRAFEEGLQRRDGVTYDRYRAQTTVVKQRDKIAKNGRLTMGRETEE